MNLPTKVKALVLRKGDANAKLVLHDAILDSIPLRKPDANEVVVKVSAVAFNHRDVRPKHCCDRYCKRLWGAN